MERADFNLVASIIRTSLAAGDMQHGAVREFIETFVRTHGAAFNVQQFLEAALPSGRREASLREITRGLRLSPAPRPQAPPRPQLTAEQMNQAELDGALFKTILDVRHPQLSAIRCAYSPREHCRFSISRMGLAVVIRFGPQALSDPAGAVEAAAEDAERMLLGQTQAVAINGRGEG